MGRVRRRRERGSGAVRQLPSGRWQARYRDQAGRLVAAPTTFDTKLDASAWLEDATGHQATIARANPVLAAYAERWLAERELKPRTRALYRSLLDGQILPSLGGLRLSKITPQTVRAWHAGLDETKPTKRAHAYSLLRAIMATAVADDLLDANPCRVRGAGSARTRHRPKVASLGELDVIVRSMPERYRGMVLLAAWCGLRFGEITELRRGDLDLSARMIRIERAVVRVDGGFLVGDPKSDAGRRTVALPPHLVPALQHHLHAHVGPEPGDLVFPARRGGHMAPATLYKVWYPARLAAGRPDLRFHDLRHTGATLAAATGATLADLMSRLGHSTSSAALRYQHAAADRDAAIAEALSGFAAANVVPLSRTRTTR
jgi:integrase